MKRATIATDAGRRRSGAASRLTLCLLLCLTVILPGGCRCGDRAAAGDKKNGVGFCEDQTQWSQWEALVEQFSWDDGMMELHALRLGICSMIFTGQLEAERGMAMFERAHYAWMARIVRLQTDLRALEQKQKQKQK